VKKGDRVRLRVAGSNRRGTVTLAMLDRVLVQWDDAEDDLGHFADELELVDVVTRLGEVG
jgi:hypothetical protein